MFKPSSPEIMGALRRHPLWAPATDQGLRAIVRVAQVQQFRVGECLFRARELADSVFVLLEGSTRMFYPGPDRSSDITVVLFAAPAVFGDAEALCGIAWAETVEALDAARALRIPTRAYLEVLKTEPQVAVAHYRDIAARLSVAIHRAQNTHFGDTLSRLVALLASYANQFGKPSPKGGVLIDFLLTRDQLGTQIGTNRRTVARALAELHARKLVRRQGRKYVVASVESLLALGIAQSHLAYSSGSRP